MPPKCANQYLTNRGNNCNVEGKMVGRESWRERAMVKRSGPQYLADPGFTAPQGFWHGAGGGQQSAFPFPSPLHPRLS